MEVQKYSHYKIKEIIDLNSPTSDQNQEDENIEPYTMFYVWGQNDQGQLGFHNQGTIVSPQTCSYNILVKQVACGYTHTHLLSQQGFIYSMGSNEEGKLGVGLSIRELPYSPTPRLIENLKEIKQISAGFAHSVAIDINHQVYGWGQGENGAIGMRLTNAFTPIEIKICDTEGEVYMCGHGECGQLGLGYSSTKEYRPAKVKDINERIIQVACGEYNTGYLTESGKIFISGDNSKGQLGIGSLIPSQSVKPIFVEQLKTAKVIKITCSQYTAALTNKGVIYVWGPYNYDCLKTPQKLIFKSDLIFRDVEVSRNLISGVDQNHNLWVWSSNESSNNLKLHSKPQLIQELKDLQINKVYLGLNTIFAMGQDIINNKEEKSEKILPQSMTFQHKDLTTISNEIKQLKPQCFDMDIEESERSHSKLDMDNFQEYDISPKKKIVSMTPIDNIYHNNEKLTFEKTQASIKSQQPTYNANIQKRKSLYTYNYKALQDKINNEKLNNENQFLSTKEGDTIDQEIDLTFDKQSNKSIDDNKSIQNFKNISNVDYQTINSQYESKICLGSYQQLPQIIQQNQMNKEEFLQPQVIINKDHDQLKKLYLENQVLLQHLSEQKYKYEELFIKCDKQEKIISQRDENDKLVEKLKKQVEELQISNQSYQDREKLLNNDLKQLKDIIKIYDNKLKQKDEELQNYADISDKLKDTEIWVEHIITEKEQREQQLLNEIYELKNNYKLEQEITNKLSLDVSKQQENIQQLQGQIKSLNSDKKLQQIEIEKLNDQISNLLVDLKFSKNNYQTFLHQIPQSSLSNESPDPLIRKQLNFDSEIQLKNNQKFQSLKPKTISKQTLQEQPLSEIHITNMNNNSINNNNIGQIVQIKQNCDDKKQAYSYHNKREDYNTFVLKSLERIAVKTSQERKTNNSQSKASQEILVKSINATCQHRPNFSSQVNLNSSMKINKQLDFQQIIREQQYDIETPREIISVLQDTQSTIQLKEVKVENEKQQLFKEVSLFKVGNEKQNTHTDKKNKQQESIENNFGIAVKNMKVKTQLREIIEKEMKEVSKITELQTGGSGPQRYLFAEIN